MKTLEGMYDGKGLKIAIVASRFNEFITTKLVGGAEDCLLRHGTDGDDITLAWVPDAIISVGAVIRGSTSHYDYVCAEVSKGIAQVGLESGLPVLFGVLTTDTIEQAIERAGTKAGNKGYDCAMSALEMVSLFKNA